MGRQVHLEFKVKLPNGKQETRRVACGKEDPLLVFFEKAFNVKFKDDALGPQVVEIEGQRSSYYHFVLIDKKTGKRYMPYAEGADGKRIYLDLRHILFSPELAKNMAIEVFMVYDHRDIGNSVTTRYDGTHAWFKLDEFTSEDLRMGDLSRMMKKHYVGNVGEDYRFHFLQLKERMQAGKPMLPAPAFSFDGFSFSFSLPAGIRQGGIPAAEPEGHGAPEPVMMQETGQMPNIAGREWRACAEMARMPVLAESHFRASEAERREDVPLHSYQGAIAEIAAAAAQYQRAGMRQAKAIQGAGEVFIKEREGKAPGRENCGRTSDEKPGKSQQGSVSDESGKGARKKPHSRPVPFSALTDFKAVIFDLDGVIVDSEMVHPRTFERALAKYGVKIDNAHWKRAYTGIGSYAIFDDIVKKYGISEDARELVKKRNEIYMEEIKRNRLPVIAGFAEVHKLLVENGVKEAVASGGHANHVEESMRSSGLKGVPFVAIEHVKRGKPAPEIFLRAAKRLKVKPSECIVFEDSLSGVEAAARAGMPCVALSTTMKAIELRGKAALIVKNYKSRKLKKLLAVLLEKRGGGAKKKGKSAKIGKVRRRKLSRNGR